VRRTIKQLLAEYGAAAVIVYLTIFFLVLFALWGAIHLGWHPTGIAGNVGSFTAAYLATKLTQPLRIAATLALTPVVARTYERLMRRNAAPAPSAVAERAGDQDAG
jgi:hypothetical protein